MTGHVACVKGQWEVGVSAGGSRNDLENFATNPQYIITLSEPGVHHDESLLILLCVVKFVVIQWLTH